MGANNIWANNIALEHIFLLEETQFQQGVDVQENEVTKVVSLAKKCLENLPNESSS